MMFSKTTREQAEEFCAHVIAREPFRLHDLARRMHATDGPLNRMDGTYASLVPLWAWFIDYIHADLPGVPHDAMPSTWPTPSGFQHDTPAHRHELTDARRRESATEGLWHYLRLVHAHELGHATWRVRVTPAGEVRDHYHHSTVIGLHGTDFIDPSFVAVSAYHVHRRRPTALEHTDLLRNVYPRVPYDLDAGPGPSLLTAFLEADPGPEPENVTTSPVTRWSDDWWAGGRATTSAPAPAPSPAPQDHTPWEDLTLARTGVHHDDLDADTLDHIPPLDTTTLARALTHAGFIGTDNHQVTTDDLTRDGTYLAHRDHTAQALTLATHGQLRALGIEPAAPTTDTWNTLITTLTDLATRIDAHLAPDGTL